MAAAEKGGIVMSHENELPNPTISMFDTTSEVGGRKENTARKLDRMNKALRHQEPHHAVQPDRREHGRHDREDPQQPGHQARVLHAIREHIFHRTGIGHRQRRVDGAKLSANRRQRGGRRPAHAAVTLARAPHQQRPGIHQQLRLVLRQHGHQWPQLFEGSAGSGVGLASGA